MLRQKNQLALIFSVLVIASLLSACRSATPLATPSGPGISVGITGDTCPNVVVQAGQQVTWTNQDSNEHVVRHNPAEGDVLFDSGTLQPGDVFAFTFSQPGIYTYECSADDVMTGMITVEQ